MKNTLLVISLVSAQALADPAPLLGTSHTVPAKTGCESQQCKQNVRLHDAIAWAHSGTCVVVDNQLKLSESIRSDADWWLVIPPDISRKQYDDAVAYSMTFANVTGRQVFFAEPISLTEAADSYCVSKFGAVKADSIGILVSKREG